MHPKGKETDKESEGLEDILDSISEKEQEAPVESMNVFQRFIGIFTAPGKVFDYLKVKPDFWFPLILAVLISIISGYMFFDVAINDQITRIEQNENIPADRKDAILDQDSVLRPGPLVVHEDRYRAEVTKGRVGKVHKSDEITGHFPAKIIPGDGSSPYYVRLGGVTYRLM